MSIVAILPAITGIQSIVTMAIHKPTKATRPHKPSSTGHIKSSHNTGTKKPKKKK